MKFETELSKNIFTSKYPLEFEKEPNEPLERVLHVVGKYYPELIIELREAISNKHVGLAGGIWRSAMNPMKNVSAINCTTLAKPEDTLESISEAQYWWQKFSAYGQGEGVDLSKLRPRGAKLHNTARTSTGAVSFMHTFDALLNVIAQEGRRGASLISLHITHPDIIEFITVKDKDGVLESANISIHITDAFMKAVENDEEWEFTFTNKYETISKKIKAKKLFNLIAEHAWKSGDPGLQFIDIAKKYSNSDYLGEPIVSTNAPVVGETLVPTRQGIFPISELYAKGDSVDVLYNSLVETPIHDLKKINHVEIAPSTFVEASFNKYDNQQVYEVSLKGYGIIKCNNEHKWFTREGYKKAEDLGVNDEIIIFPDGIYNTANLTINTEAQSYKEGIVCGWLTGDGWFGKNYSNGLTEQEAQIREIIDEIGRVNEKGCHSFEEIISYLWV